VEPRDAALPSWNDTPTRRAIVAFVEAAARAGDPGYLAPEERIAVFDNDGTLWCEKPMPIELGFILEQLTQMAEQDTALREQQPWKAAYTKDYAWLGGAITKHYQGDDSVVKVLLVGVLKAFAGWTVERYEAAAAAFLRGGAHPTLKRSYCECTYLPMVELLRYLEAHGFTTFMASAGDRDFMRAVTQEIYGIPPERVIGSTNALGYQENGPEGTLVYQAAPDVFDDGPAKPVRIWSRIGRRPAVAVGNSNGDLPMMQFSGSPNRPSFRLLLLHDDAAREFDYVAGAEDALERAQAQGWTVISIKNDWATVFGSPQDPGAEGTTAAT
jgi:phosphoserine phosphatase